MKRLFKSILPLVGIPGLVKLILLSLLSGCSSFLFINFVNKVVGYIIAGRFSVGMREKYAIIFASIILLFILVRRALSLSIIRLSQTIFWDLRRQILSSVLHANYMQLSAKKIEVHAAIVSDVNMLTSMSLSLISLFTSSILAFVTLIYLASISFVLFLITLVISIAGCVIYYYGSILNKERFEHVRKLENSFLRYMHDILNGFKEIYMEPGKGRVIFEDKIEVIAEDAYETNITAFTASLNNQITGQVLFYLLISLILLFLGHLFNIDAKDTVSFVFTLLFLLGAIETIMALLPALLRAKVASNRLIDLKNDLETIDGQDKIMPLHCIQKSEFFGITVKGLEFRYKGEGQEFCIGPVNFEVVKGETIFIYGGNGSGKTTFVHAMIGLYQTSAGEISLNDGLVTADNYPEYRTVFSTVFSDFYLFSELFGLSGPDMDKWSYYLRLFELEGKVKLENKCFSTTNLSMGQRKRLALIICLLENKPVLILDEWAADQDPYFRKKFYTEIIPLLKLEGTTIIAITHDDKYYHCADKLYKMNYGKLIEVHIDEHATSY